MALFLPALLKSINDRLSGDTGTGGLTTLLGNGATSVRTSFPPPGVDPPGTTYPLVTITPVSDEVDDGFLGRFGMYTIEVRLFVAEQSTTQSVDTLLLMMKLHERVIGDWPEQTDRNPTYGLDGWLPSFTGYTGDFVSAYTATTMDYTGYTDQTEPIGGIREWCLNFRVGLFKKRP